MKGRPVPPRNDRLTSFYPLWLIILFTLWTTFLSALRLTLVTLSNIGAPPQKPDLKGYYASVADLPKEAQRYYYWKEAFINRTYARYAWVSPP